jgi:putative transposase
VGASRYAYNYLLSCVKAARDQRKAEIASGVAENELTPYFPSSHYDLRKHWNAKKDIVAPWWRENSKEAYSDGTKRLSLGLSNHRDSLTGKRKGKSVGFPKYHKRGQHESVRFTTGNIGVTVDRHHVLLPVIGQIRTHESTRKLARRIEAATARILSATLSRSGGKWFVSFTVEVEAAITPTRLPVKIVGVDLGVTTLYKVADCNGNTILDVPNPKHTKQSEQSLCRAQRKAARKIGPAPGVEPSARWKKANSRVTRVQRNIANVRRDVINKSTTFLAKTCDVIVVETLGILGMAQNHHLSKAIYDAGWGEFIRQLKYKTAWYGSVLIQADQWYPSSKTCSRCEVVKAKLLLSEREFKCNNCGLIIDRDLNAAINLAKLGLCNTSESSSGTGRGGLHKTKVSLMSDINVVADEASILKQPAMVV